MLNPGPDRRLRLTRRFEAAPERVFNAWLDVAKMRQWLFAMPGDEDWQGQTEARVGGRWTITSRRGAGTVWQAVSTWRRACQSGISRLGSG
jgi:uncharacterized protein YndB with AHSA1/START domain